MSNGCSICSNNTRQRLRNPALFLPYSAKFGPDGNLYVTTGAVCNADGTSSFGGGNLPCAIGEKKGGRLVKISLNA